ncbi:MAG: CRISPR-associated protein Cas4 [Gammaproteobacteria bacterium]|nr:CRISPR-associated protein Cas4 [Gammaproteobacteria bacterium]
MAEADPESTPLVSETDFVPISALQHFLYCPRQCAFIHVERVWMENRPTAEGRILHGRVEEAVTDRRSGVRAERSVAVCSRRLGLAGIVDVVEVHQGGRVFPVEYKRGRPKRHRADEVQLCAQAVCLEEMLDQPIPEGALFYGRSRRRTSVVFDTALRDLTAQTAREVRGLIESGTTPSPVYERWKCDSCSLKEACKPEKLQRPPAVERWLAEALA